MKVAFDLDDTLISNTFSDVEKPPKYLCAKLLKPEQLRKGTVEIFKFCKQQGWETWIYTTSLRSKWRVKFLFWLHGIHLDGFINQTIHNENVKIRSSKHPPTFGIDVIIDDSEGLAIEGKRYGFTVIVIDPNNRTWVTYLQEKLIKAKTRLVNHG